jgi:uncharacterized protein YcbK (DUF882 family)
MHRFTVSMLALSGALFLPHGSGHADPRAESAPAKGAKSKEINEAGEAPAKQGGAKKAAPADSKKTASPAGKGTAGSKSAPAWTRAQPGVVKLVRGSESLEVRVLDKKQRLVPTTLPQFAKFLRSKGGADHPIDARLVTLVATVSDHFGGREVNVVSGFRPYSPTQYSRHSNHNEGRAIDFSIKGIANETVRDFCRTLHNVGVGYYPNSLFVHLDVRDSNAYWVDYAAPGQAPRYRAPDGTIVNDDEDAVVSVDPGPRQTRNPSETLRSDIERGRSTGLGLDTAPTGTRSATPN